MTNQKEKRKVPELRFPEFSGEWEVKKLGEIAEFKNGINKDKSDFGEGIPFVNLMDVFGKNIISNDNFSLIKANKSEIENYSLRKGDVLFIRFSVKRSGVGQTVIVKESLTNTIYSGFLIRMREKYNILAENYKRYYFYNNSFRKQILKKSTSSANTNINQEELSKLIIKFPSFTEQQKIGEFFSKLDRQIELEEKKLALLEEQKKGYMQKIFSQELRFKDENGEEYPEWEEKKLSEVAEYSNGLAHEEYVNESGNYTLINSKFISTDGKTKKEVTKSLLTANEGDIAMVLSDLPNGKALGKCYFVMEDKKYAINQRIALLKVKKGNSFFIYQILNRNKKLLRYDNGVSQTNLRKDNVLNLTINIPVIIEQNKIAKIFSAFNERISYQQNKINYLIKNKKYLINKMLV